MNGITNIGEILNDLEIDRDAWQARAEAAETDLRELRENTLLALGLNPVNVADGTEDATIAYLLSGLKDRIAALESQLAAPWRPVTEPPTDNGDYLVYCWPGEYEVMTFWDGYWAGGIPVYHWRPLPAPPID